MFFVDLGGSTKLYDLLGDEAALSIVSECIDCFISVVEDHGGTVIKTIGDEVMSTFPSANQAADTAAAILWAMDKTRSTDRRHLDAHVGFHVGAVLRESGDVFGDTVNLAARLVGLAKANEILTTRQGVDALSPDGRNRTRLLDRLPISGKKDELEIFELTWKEANLTVMSPASTEEASLEGDRLILQFERTRFELSKEQLTLTIGRDGDNDVVVPDPLVSRRHAHVILWNGKFVLTDESANGTLVRLREGKVIALHRENLILHDSGSIGFGRYVDTTSELPITFVLESGA